MYIYVYIYIYIHVCMYMYIYTHIHSTCPVRGLVMTSAARAGDCPRLFRLRLDGYLWPSGCLVLQGNIPFRTAYFLELPARQILGTRWAKYPFSRCRSFQGESETRCGGYEARGVTSHAELCTDVVALCHLRP